MSDKAYGLDIDDLPDGWMPLELVVALRCLNEDGEETAVLRQTAGLNEYEVIGLLRSAERYMLHSNPWSDDTD